MIPRRALLTGAAGTLGAAILGRAAPAQTPAPQDIPADPTKVPGGPLSEVGSRSAFEQPRRMVQPQALSASSRTPLQDLEGIVTPSDLHFERHHAGVPKVDPRRYRLMIHGMVGRPMNFSLADLKRYPQESRLYFIECSGNGGAGYRNVSPDRTPQQVDGLLSTSEWIGVSLATLFREVGVQSGASWFLAEGMDGAAMTRSIPVAKGMDDALLAYGQNGEALRPEQGYPVRLLLPGWEGNASVKWLRRIELSDAPFMTRQETAKYSDPLPDCTARLFSFEMDAKSTLTFPVYPDVITPGWWEIKGLAWSGRGRITRVEVSTDGGVTWHEAALQEPVLSKCPTRFRFMWSWNGRETVLMSRATDETGYVQPTREQLMQARGQGTRYHFNNIRSWKVAAGGAVTLTE
ncbi:MAG TPA: sulfite dehydrogenase [Gemmatimonadales bacterium]